MGWVIFEVFLAFCLAVFIVWWTLPKTKKKPKIERGEEVPGKQDNASR